MWPRNFEVCFGCWLAMSRFIFRYAPESTFLANNDLICGFLICVFSLGSYFPRLGKLYLMNFLIAGWLFYLSYTYPDPTILPPGVQNYIVVALLLFIFAIIPSDRDTFPKAWMKYFKDT